MSPKQILTKGVILGLFAALLSAGAFFAYVAWYTGTDRILPGVTIGDVPVGGLARGEAERRLGGGTAARVSQAVNSAVELGRQGPIWRRARTFVAGALHGHRVPLESSLQAEQTRDVETNTFTGVNPEKVSSGVSHVDLAAKPVDPAKQKEDLPDTRQHQIARFTTKIYAADAGRVHNIKLAAQKISGVVLKPGDVFSFNKVVGPRDEKHGWAKAAELYQGEFVMGYGGGICQVSSTLYNSVLLGGLEVRERYHHDRPLQYIDPGRDATVVWDLLDFKFRNSMDVPVMIEARLLPGDPQQVEVSLFSPRPVPEDRVRIEEAEVRYFPPPMEEVLDKSLPAEERKVEHEGHYGIEVKIFRVFHENGKARRELVSHDRYEPKPGKVRVGVGNAPGSDRLLAPGLF